MCFLYKLYRYFSRIRFSPRNKETEILIYPGGCMSAQMMCDILWESVKVCTGLKCEFLICVCTRCMFGIYVCVGFWVWVPSKQECAFINVWILKRLTTCKQSRCFNEFSNILRSALIFFNKGQGEKKEMGDSFFLEWSKFLPAENADYRLWDIYSLNFFLSWQMMALGVDQKWNLPMRNFPVFLADYVCLL